MIFTIAQSQITTARFTISKSSPGLIIRSMDFLFNLDFNFDKPSVTIKKKSKTSMIQKSVQADESIYKGCLVIFDIL